MRDALIAADKHTSCISTRLEIARSAILARERELSLLRGELPRTSFHVYEGHPHAG